MGDFQNLKNQAAVIRDEQLDKKNTALRIGKMFIDMFEQLENVLPDENVQPDTLTVEPTETSYKLKFSTIASDGTIKSREVSLPLATETKAGIMSPALLKGVKDQLTELEEKIPNTNFITCSTLNSVANKTVNILDFKLSNRVRLLIKMTNANTADNAYLSISSPQLDTKPLYYNGERASSTNSWEAGAVLDVYYDGTNFQATDFQGGDGREEIERLEQKVEEVGVKNEDYVEGDFGISDEFGNVILELCNGHVYTKNFNSEDVGKSIEHPVETQDTETQDVDFELADDNGYVLAQISNGHIRTKNFDSSRIDSNPENMLNYTDRSLITSSDEWSGKVPTYDEVIALYDQLIGEYEDIDPADDYTGSFVGSSGYFPYKYRVEKHNIGKDQSGTYDIFKYVLSPTDYRKTVIFHCVMHGNEEQTTLAMYQLLKHIVHYDDICQKSDVLSYMRKYVRIVIIPVLNPYGLEKRIYGNINKVNPSRNFGYRWNEYQSTNSEWDKKGSSAFSEAETRLLLKVYMEYLTECDFIIDYHTGEGWDKEPMFYYDKTDDYVRPAIIRAGEYIVKISGKNNPETFETSRALGTFYVNRCLGVPCATIEYGTTVYSSVRNSVNQLSPLMWNYTVYWTELFSLPKRSLNKNPSIVKLTREEYKKLPFRVYNTLYYITDETDVILNGDFNAKTGDLEQQK